MDEEEKVKKVNITIINELKLLLNRLNHLKKQMIQMKMKKKMKEWMKKNLKEMQNKKVLKKLVKSEL